MSTYPLFPSSVPEFEATKYLVTNRDFLEFVRADGYQRQDLWTEEGGGCLLVLLCHIHTYTHIHTHTCKHLTGWKWVKYRQANHPTFWVCDEGCKSGCGADLAGYSHCNLAREGQNGTAGENGAAEQNGSAKRKLEHKFK